jgi:hypothetical protein
MCGTFAVNCSRRGICALAIIYCVCTRRLIRIWFFTFENKEVEALGQHIGLLKIYKRSGTLSNNNMYLVHPLNGCRQGVLVFVR